MGLPYAEVIGDPIAHSKSPLIHEHWLRRRGIAGEYRRTHVRPVGLAEFFEERRRDREWRGCNVTVPHKEAVVGLVDRLDERAAAVGAVNCVVPEGDRLVGYNSDVDGVAAALEGIALDGRKAAVIGAGGAARAALAFLAEQGVGEVAVLVRDPANASPLEGIVPGSSLAAGPFEDAAALLAGSALVINASPLGMTGCPDMPDGLLAAVAALDGATLFDMVYSPLETRFLAVGRDCRINGLRMLVGQAARAFELFFGAPAPTPDPALLDLLTGSA